MSAASDLVSIHTRHYWRVKPDEARPKTKVSAVSIHTRHYWRVKQIFSTR